VIGMATATQTRQQEQMQQLLTGLTAVRGGDFSTRLPEARDPLMNEIAAVFNAMNEQLSVFTSEVTRVAREVGVDGKLGGQAEVPAVAGTWKDLTDSVNAMAGNLTGQVRNIAQVTTAVARGDLSQKISVEAKGEVATLAETINGMVDTLSAFAGEVTRVAREVGTEGRLGGQAEVPGVGGTWRDLTESVNFMAGNLTSQVRNIAQVTTAVAKGDLSQKITVDARGEILELKNTVNTMVDQLSAFADEVTRMAREVGTEGRLGGQAQVPGVGGTWRDLTDSVNFMAGNLTAQVRSIAQVATAVAKGDLSQKITVDARGEILELKNTINTMVDTLSAFSGEVTRVAREVGTEGRLGGQADVQGVSGTWKDLTESVNVMAANLTAQVRSIAQVTTAVAKGDLSQKIRVDARGEILELKETINTMVDQLSSFAGEVTRVARDVGTQGKLGGQAIVQGVSGTWEDLTDNVNVMASNLTAQVRSIAQVATAVARGDLSQKITVEAKGEVAALAGTINGMVDTLSAFAGEVTRVGREVGTEGILGGQATVPNVAGTWKDLTDNVNSMANNLTSQVRNIAQVTTAVAQGDLTKKIDVDARGEILELKTTINTMVDQLSSFAAEVTRVAREVGREGRLGGQAEVEGVSGTWKRLTENVNELAGNLTRQVRAISEVTSAVATGDLTRSISVEAQGEVAELKDNINTMVRSLRETTEANQQQGWLQTNLAKIAGLMQGERDLAVVAELIMNELIPVVGGQLGAFFIADSSDGQTRLRLIAGYGLNGAGAYGQVLLGQSLIGQVAKTRKPIVLDRVPAGYARISSAIGEARPVNVMIVPIVFEDQVLGVIEAGSLWPFTQVHRDFLEQLMDSIGVNVNTMIANARTDALLEQSQRLTAELQARQQELQSSNAELADKAALLAAQNRDIETKNAEIEQARQEIEERALQLDQASRYKSQFLANMSHELRTPLNSLLVLARLLAQNPDGNLTGKQVEYATIIHSSGSDLLRLINDILDLTKVEAGKMDINLERFALAGLVEDLRGVFGPLAEEKRIRFTITTAPVVPADVETDKQRLRQILYNLLSNAVKFTDHGHVELHIDIAGAPRPGMGDGPWMVFSVTDSGIGISRDNLTTIFSAFQQGDGTTSRRYGGTGLGLAICREVAARLGGEVTVQSELGAGSTFSLHLPLASLGATHPRGFAQPSPVTIGRGTMLEQAASASDADPAAVYPVPAAMRHEPLRGHKVLVVDDDPRNAFVLTDVLEMYGMTVVQATDGRKAITELAAGDIDLVLMDVMMPQMDGYETTRAIRKMPQYADLPVITVTARAMQGDREKSIDAGASDYITKPIDVEELLDCMERWLAPSPLRRA
jgi:HAMP domain-containing protein/signal transduction histidine kinase/ActR/RegA family two-component response regulator